MILEVNTLVLALLAGGAFGMYFGILYHTSAKGLAHGMSKGVSEWIIYTSTLFTVGVILLVASWVLSIGALM